MWLGHTGTGDIGNWDRTVIMGRTEVGKAAGWGVSAENITQLFASRSCTEAFTQASSMKMYTTPMTTGHNLYVYETCHKANQ